MKQVWTRAAHGDSSAILGGPIPIATTEGVRPLRVPCDLPRGPLGPLLEARDRARRQLGRHKAETAVDRFRTGLRRTLLGDTAPEDALGEIVAALNQLADASTTPRALVLDPVEAADPATIAALIRLVERPGWLRMPLVLGFRVREPGLPAAGLVTTLERMAGADAILRVGPDDPADLDDVPGLPADLPPLTRRLLRAAALAGPAFEVRVVAGLLDMRPLDVLELLQSAADHGVPLEDDGEDGFRIPAPMAETLRTEILPSLARAWHRALAALFHPDAPAADPPAPPPRRDPTDSELLGPDLHSAPPPAVPPEALWTAVVDAEARNNARAHSLEASLHAGGGTEGRRSAPDAALDAASDDHDDSDDSIEDTREFTRVPDPEVGFVPGVDQRRYDRIETPFGSVDQAPGEPRDRDRGITDGPAALMDDEALDDSVERTFSDLGRLEPGDESLSDRFDGGIAEGLFDRADAAETAASGLRDAALAGSGFDPSHMLARRERHSERHTDRRGGADAARAADHLAAAGDATGATAKLIHAAVDAAALGAAEQALAILHDALAALDRLPDSRAHHALRARALAEAARIQWTGVGPDARFTLEAAREAAAAAEQALSDDAPTALRGEIASLRAHILYDVGGDAAMEEALALLTRASHALEAAGDPLEAARLFNDQAAIWVRLGDPVRAHHLLEASRKVFAARADHDPLARLELADTEHVIGRLPFYVPARPGREHDAAALGIRHTRSAEQVYAELDRPWERARTWETLGRLELKRGRIDRAIEHLERASRAQQALGDVLGLAATVECLARALTAAGRPQVAIALLHDSLALNAEKGSLQGIGYLRRTVGILADAMSEAQREEMAGAMAEFGAEMDRIEEALQPV